MSELLPCPFCGSEAHTAAKNIPNWTWNWCSVICDGCGAKVSRAGNEGTYQGAEKAAIEAWNTRAERTCELIPTRGVKYRTHTPTLTCSECGAIYELSEAYPNETLHGFAYCPNCGAKVVG